MPHLVHLRRAVGWCLVALLATGVLMNLVGFFSPFWGHLRHPGDPTQSRALLDAVTPWAAALSVLFLLPAWHVSRTLASPLARCVVVLMGALVLVADLALVWAFNGIGDPMVARLVASVAAGYPFVAFIVFIWLLWRGLHIAASPQAEPGGI